MMRLAPPCRAAPARVQRTAAVRSAQRVPRRHFSRSRPVHRAAEAVPARPAEVTEPVFDEKTEKMEKMNLFTAINNALGIALESDPKAYVVTPACCRCRYLAPIYTATAEWFQSSLTS